MISLLKKHSPELARYIKADGETIQHLAVMCDRFVLSKTVNGKKSGKWKSLGLIQNGLTIQAYCQRLLINGWEME